MAAQAVVDEIRAAGGEAFLPDAVTRFARWCCEAMDRAGCAVAM